MVSEVLFRYDTSVALRITLIRGFRSPFAELPRGEIKHLVDCFYQWHSRSERIREKLHEVEEIAQNQADLDSQM